MAKISKIQVGEQEYFLDSGMELTQAQYDALTEEEKYNGTTYYIIDGSDTSIIPISRGGTGATTAAGAKSNLGLGTQCTFSLSGTTLTITPK